MNAFRELLKREDADRAHLKAFLPDYRKRSDVLPTLIEQLN